MNFVTKKLAFLLVAVVSLLSLGGAFFAYGVNTQRPTLGQFVTSGFYGGTYDFYPPDRRCWGHSGDSGGFDSPDFPQDGFAERRGIFAPAGGGWTDWQGETDLWCMEAYISAAEVSDYNNDFRFCIQLADDGFSQAGAVQCTRWAIDGGGWSNWASDSNFYDPNYAKVGIETRPLPSDKRITDVQAGMQVSDEGHTQMGPAKFTPWASQGGGWSLGATDTNGNRADYARIYLAANVVAVAPPPPTNPSASCPNPGTSANVSWSSVPGATHYALRVDKDPSSWNGACDGGQNPGDICENTGGVSRQFSGDPGHNYNWWAHACNSAGCSDSVGGNFTCVAPPPLPDLITPSLSLNIRPEFPREGDIIRFLGTVRNSGGTSSGPFKTRLRIVLQTGEVITPELNDTGSLAPSSFEEEGWRRVGIPAGDHRFQICADQPRNDVSESREGNNCSTKGFRVEAAPPPQCSDGRDNDGDGLIDFGRDPGCDSPSDNDEYNAPPGGSQTRPPTAGAGPDKTVNEGQGVTLDGSGSDPDGDSISFSWTQIGGPGVDFRRDIPNPSFTAPQVGEQTTLSFRLTVSSRDGSASGDVNVTVNDVPSGGGTTPPQCSDGRDNDGDGLIDFGRDPGCDSPSDDDEYNAPPTPTSTPGARCDHSFPRDTFRGCVFEGTDYFNEDRFVQHIDSGMPIQVRDSVAGRSDNFSITYRGKFSFSGRYRFYTESDDGSWMYVNGPGAPGEIIDNGGDHGPQRREREIDLNGDYDVQVNYYEHGGGAFLQAGWDRVGGALPPSTSTPTPTPGARCDHSFPRDTFRGCVYRDIVIDPNSGEAVGDVNRAFIGYETRGNPFEHGGLLGESETFTVEWRGDFYFDAGARYKFFTESDDGSWLWIHDEPGLGKVINNGGWHGRQYKEFFYTFPTSGFRRVQINFFEDWGGEYLRAGFERPGQCDLGSPRNTFDGCLFDGTDFKGDRFIKKVSSGMPINISQTFEGKSDNFSVVYRGHFESFNGRYRFWTDSDDGSTLDIRRPDGSDYRLVIDNNGFHPRQRKEAVLDLSGDYIVQTHFFEGTGDAFLNAGWEKLTLCDTSFPRDRFHGCAFEGEPYFDENRLYHQYDTTGGPSTVTINESLGGRSDKFSTTLRGKFNFPRGKYKFWTDSDDGSWMYVWKEGAPQQEVINNGGDHGRRRVENIELLDGDYLVQVNFYENGGDAFLNFGWDAFRCDEGMNPENTFVGCVFDGSSFDRGFYAGTIQEQNTPNPVTGSHTAFTEDWGTSRGPLGRTDNFSVIWFGDVNFKGGAYRFYTRSDDGSRLSVEPFGDVVDNWGSHGDQTRYSDWYRLSEGAHRMVSHFFENGGVAFMETGWEKAPDLAVSCSASPSSAYVGQDVTWSASGSGGVSPYSYRWSGTVPLSGKTGSPVSVSYDTEGTKTGSVTVTDTLGQTATASCSNTVTVTYPPPCIGVCPPGVPESPGGPGGGGPGGGGGGGGGGFTSSAGDSPVGAGESVILSWSTRFADSCTITDDNPSAPDVGPVPLSCNPPSCDDSDDTVAPTVTTTYTLTCTGRGGSTSARTTVNVLKVPRFREVVPQ